MISGRRTTAIHTVVIAVLLALGLIVRNPVLSLVLIPLLGADVVYLRARRLSRDAYLPRIALVNFGLALSVTIGLYVLSGVRHPVVESLVFKKGFWFFGGDAIYYHQLSQQLAHSLRLGVPFPEMDPTYGAAYAALLGLLYFFLGAHPLLAPLVNCVLATVSVLLLYALVARIWSTDAARRAVLVAGVWPSLFLWSSQAMKDVPSLFLFMAMIVLAVQIADGAPRSTAKTSRLVALLVVAVFVLSLLRSYLAVLALVTFVMTTVLFAVLRRQLRLMAILAIAGIFLGAFAERVVGPNVIVLVLNPTHSSAARAYAEGLALEKKGELAAARDEYLVAIQYKDNFWPAYRRLGEVLIRLGDIPEAAERALRHYVALNPSDYSAPLIFQIVARLEQSRHEQDALVRRWPSVVVVVASDGRHGSPQGSPSPPTPPAAAPSTPASSTPAVETIEDAAERYVRMKTELRDELVRMFDDAPKTYSIHGNFMLEDAHTVANQAIKEMPAAGSAMLRSISPQTAAASRNGFVRTGGDSLYTREMAAEKGDLLQWLKWSPQAFITVFAAPYPWQWSKDGRLSPIRVAMGAESLALLVLLLPAVHGVWRLRRGGIGGWWVVVLCFALGTGLGLTVINVGTLARLRLPVILLLIGLAAAGWSPSRRTTPSAGSGRDCTCAGSAGS